ncbi:MAG TPA: SDR family oxidoreductase, partial [Candidatus Nitrosotalea sp.]|nr:SDR family oxidoreductase [Candidatus Nitrosotalea sp.]
MKIFLTGHLGYVGSILAKQLLKENFEITGYDVGYFTQESENKISSKIIFIKKDLRNVIKDDLKGCDAVLHLAALSNDPLGELNSSLTHDINYSQTVKLAKLAKESGVEKFIFSSSCSTYGASKEIVNETSHLSPITAYAKSKVDSEYEILKLKGEQFYPVILRSATAYGMSPNLRLDLVVNNLVCSAFTTGKVKLLSDGTAWRPLVHVEDMANAFITVLKASQEKTSGETFNVGSNEENYTVKQIAETVQDIVPNSTIEYAQDSNKDARTYRVDFSKIKNQIGYKTNWKLKDGIQEIYNQI